MSSLILHFCSLSIFAVMALTLPSPTNAQSFADIFGAIVEVGKVDANARLQDQLHSANAETRLKAAQALTVPGMADAGAVDALISTLRDQDSRVRMWSAVALGVSGNPRAIDGLIAKLNDQTFEVRFAAGSALSNLTYVDLGLDAQAWRAWWQENRGKFTNR